MKTFLIGLAIGLAVGVVGGYIFNGAERRRVEAAYAEAERLLHAVKSEYAKLKVNAVHALDSVVERIKKFL